MFRYLRFKKFDKRGVRAFVCYSEGNGSWRVECYRKRLKKEMTEQEIAHQTGWKMKREGHIQSYMSRNEAEIKALEMAQNICDKYGF